MTAKTNASDPNQPADQSKGVEALTAERDQAQAGGDHARAAELDEQIRNAGK